MNDLINRAVIPVINASGITSFRLDRLIYLKEFIDRISTKPYIKTEELNRLEAQYGVTPDIITWGDYFQAEIATMMQGLNDDEFVKVLDTIKFDIISSYYIFKDKNCDFFNWIENSYHGIEVDVVEKLNDEDKETVHLKILMDYYSEIGIVDGFNESELRWYSSFKEAMAI